MRIVKFFFLHYNKDKEKTEGDIDMKKEESFRWIEEHSDDFYAASDAIWDAPELAFTEFTAEKVQTALLEKLGFTVTRGLAGIPTAFSGRWGEGKPVIGFLGEFDALSGLSQKACIATPSPITEGGCGHGCGHNLLGVGSIAAAAAYKEYLSENGLPGTVIYYGCPGEEGGSGKAFMARDGVFDELDCAISWHPSDATAINNASSLANCQVLYRFKGVSAHAAACPHLGRSALDGLELMNVGVQFLREHMIPEARIHYAITNSGGASPNVVQSEAEVLYLIRSPKNSEVRELHERVSDIAKGAALMTGTQVEEEFIKACSGLTPNNVLEEVMWKNIETLPMPEYTEEELSFAKEIRKTCPSHKDFLSRCKEAVGRVKGAQYAAGYDDSTALFLKPIPYAPSDAVHAGSTDVGDVSCVCPVVQANVQTIAADSPGHSWQIVAQGKSSTAHKGELYAARIMAATAIDLYGSPETIEAAKAELKERLAPDGGKYIPPIPKGVKPRSMASLSQG